jgi:hypothetical protein
VNAIAIGRSATGSEDGVSIGVGANSTGSRGVAIGANSVGAEDSVAVGLNSNVHATTFSIAVGFSADAFSEGSTSVGSQSSATGTDSTAIGRYALTSANEAIALGHEPEANAMGAIAIGSSRTNGANHGDAPLANDENAIAIGSGFANGLGSQPGAIANDEGSIAIGGSDGVLAGAYTEAVYQGSCIRAIAIGSGSHVQQDDSIALGTAAKVPDTRTASIAIGAHALVAQAHECVIGSTTAGFGFNKFHVMAETNTPLDLFKVDEAALVAANDSAMYLLYKLPVSGTVVCNKVTIEPATGYLMVPIV